MRHPVACLIYASFLLPASSWIAQAQCPSEIKVQAVELTEADRLHIQQALQGEGTCSSAKLAADAAYLTRDLGYFKAKASDENQANGASVVTITPGARYHLGEFTLRGNRSLSREQLQTAFALQAGDLLRWTLIGKTLENIQIAYRNAGLRNEVTNPVAVVNDTDHTVSFDLQIDEGASPQGN